MTLCGAEVIGPVFAIAQRVIWSLSRQSLQGLNRCVGVGDSFVFKRREDTLWEHEELQLSFFCVMKEDIFQS